MPSTIPSFYGPAATAERMLIRFTGPVLKDGRPTYQEYCFYDLFYSEQQILAGEKPQVDPAVFRDKIVVVGTTAAGLHDVFTVPFAEGKHARDAGARQHHRQPAVAAVHAARSAPAGTCWCWSPARWSVGVAAASLAVWRAAGIAAAGRPRDRLGVASVLFGRGVWMEVAAPGAGGGVRHLRRHRVPVLRRGAREAAGQADVLALRVAGTSTTQLMADPSSARVGGARREMSVLFSDIRGFTTFTERGRPEEVVAQLNEYFSRMVEVVFAHRGTVDKFVGDMVMALFGAPLDDPDHADHAVQAALGDAGRARRPERAVGGGGPARSSTSASASTAATWLPATSGPTRIMSYTVIGDAVNLGSRLESLNKEYGTRIIISDGTRARLKGRYDMKPAGNRDRQGQVRAGDHLRGALDGRSAGSDPPCRIDLAAVLIAAVVLAVRPGDAGRRRAPDSGLPKSKELTEVMKRAHQLRDLQVTEAEELKLGADVSEQVRDRYGVVQDAAVHRYVTLVGTLLVKKSTRPNLPFRFIVLDTDGVNAFAAPGGFIHITRGALGLMTNEAELAGVLAHEISHVTEKHTIKAIQKGKMIQITAEESITKNPGCASKLVDVTSDLVLAGFGRGEETRVGPRRASRWPTRRATRRAGWAGS